MYRCFSAFVLLFSLTTASFAQATQISESWNNLKHVTHRATFIFVKANKTCIAGMIDSITDTTLVVKEPHGQPITINREELSRVSDGDWGGGVLFSSRSSWADVNAVTSLDGRTLKPTVFVETKSGRTQQGILINVSEDEITMDSQHKIIHFAKADISNISYLTAKPLSNSASYADDELAWMKIFDPELWPKMFGFQGSLTVQLFNANLPEDNSSIVCRNDPFGLRASGPELTKRR
jgi:hypothetical protein